MKPHLKDLEDAVYASNAALQQYESALATSRVVHTHMVNVTHKLLGLRQWNIELGQALELALNESPLGVPIDQLKKAKAVLAEWKELYAEIAL